MAGTIRGFWKEPGRTVAAGSPKADLRAERRANRRKAKLEGKLRQGELAAAAKLLGLPEPWSINIVSASACADIRMVLPHKRNDRKAAIVQYLKSKGYVRAKRAERVTRTHPVKRLNPIGKPHPDWKRDDSFYSSNVWRELRYMALKLHGARCQCCGATPADGVKIHVDHVEPIYKRPDLKLQLSNLQCLCADCNLGKSAWDNTDWREHFRSI